MTLGNRREAWCGVIEIVEIVEILGGNRREAWSGVIEIVEIVEILGGTFFTHFLW